MADFTLIVMNDTQASGVASAIDMLTAARELAGSTAGPVPVWRICSAAGGDLCLSSAFVVKTEPLRESEAGDGSVWIIPPLAVDVQQEIPALLQTREWQAMGSLLRLHLQRGGEVAAAGSAVLVLHLAGALKNRIAAGPSWLAPTLRRMDPEAGIDPSRSIWTDGPLTTCSSAVGQPRLMLHVLERFCGEWLTACLERDWMPGSGTERPSSRHLDHPQQSDPMVDQVIERVESSLPDAPSVAALAKELCVSERTLSRHVRRVTGESTIALIQTIKVRRARTLLEGSRMSVEDVASAVGYTDSTALRRLIKKVTGVLPSKLRSVGQLS